MANNGKKKILLIDDDEKIIKVISQRLKANGYEIFSATDGEDGLGKVVTEKPDLVVLDIKMPKVDGWSLVQKLRKGAATKNIPIIILTGYDQMQDLFAVEGVHDYIVKPFKSEDLLHKIEKLLAHGASND